jgi:predicted transcriptional regulator
MEQLSGRLTVSRAQEIRTILSQAPTTIQALSEATGQPYAKLRASIEVLMRQGHVIATGQEVKSDNGQRLKLYTLTQSGYAAAEYSTAGNGGAR